MPSSPLAIALLAFCLAGLIFALLKGGAAERLGATVVLINLVSGFHRALPLPPGLSPTIQLILDGLTALALLALVLRYGSLWLGAVMLLYAVQFGLHAYYLVTDRPAGDRLHAMVNNLTFSGIIWCLIIGTAIAWHRRARLGSAQPVP